MLTLFSLIFLICHQIVEICLCLHYSTIECQEFNELRKNIATSVNVNSRVVNLNVSRACRQNIRRGPHKRFNLWVVKRGLLLLMLLLLLCVASHVTHFLCADPSMMFQSWLQKHFFNDVRWIVFDDVLYFWGWPRLREPRLCCLTWEDSEVSNVFQSRNSSIWDNRFENFSKFCFVS